MHWAPEHVDPLLALRTAVCADRWDEAWGQLSVQLRANAHTPTRARQAERRQARAARAATEPAATPPPPLALLPPPPPPPAPHPPPRGAQPRRPAANHPWRRMSIGRAGTERAAS